MGMFNFVVDSFKGEIFDFKVDRQVLVASTVIDHSEVCLPFSRLLLSIWSIWDVVFHENYSKLYIEEVNFELLRLLQSNVSK